MEDIKNLLSDVKTEVARVGDEVKNVAEDALKVANSNSEITASIKEQASKLLNEQGELGRKQKELQDRQHSLEQLVTSRNVAETKPKIFSEHITNSEEFNTFRKNGCSGKMRCVVENAITSITPGGGGLIWSDREEGIVSLPRQNLTIRSLLTQGSTSTNLIEYAQQTLRENNAAIVAETAQKPESNYAYEKADAPVRTIAHWVHISRQAIDDASQLRTEIDGELRYGLMLEEERQILKGDGVGDNLSGLVTQATGFSPDFTPQAETLADKLMLAALQASLAEYPADGVVINPVDWARIVLTKNTDNNYIMGGPQSALGPTIWNLPVITTRSMDVDKFLVGAFRTAATIYDRMSTEVLISSEDRDNFIKNMYTIRAEKRLALAVKRPAALIYGDFGNVTE